MNIRNNNEKENIIVTGSAGFIGYHLSKSLLEDGFNVIGIDSLNNYYDLSLKNKRNDLLKSFNNYNFYELHLEDYGRLTNIFEKYSPKYVFHLAAQAGVRYSIENPREYLSSNIIGTYNLLEISSVIKPDHFLLASTSSVYGSNKVLPFNESQKTDEQMSFYAASKKSCEIMAHSFSHINKLPYNSISFLYSLWSLGKTRYGTF